MAIEITIDGVDVTNRVLPESLNIGGTADNGACFGGSFLLDDDDGTFLVPDPITISEPRARRVVVVKETATTPDTILMRGRIATGDMERGDVHMNYGRRKLVYVEDQNTHLRGILVGTTAPVSRPAETDYARGQWLASTYLNGSPRASTVLDYTTYFPNTNTVILEAREYQGMSPEEVLAEMCRASGKIFFVTVDNELVYTVPTDYTYAATLNVTDYLAEVNNTTTFAPIPDGYAATHDANNLLTGAMLQWSGGWEYINSPSYAAEYDWWEGVISDDQAQSAADAASRLSAIFAHRQAEKRVARCAIKFHRSQVDLVKVGQVVDIKWRVIPEAQDVYAKRRVSTLRWEYDGPEYWIAHLEMDRQLRALQTTGTPIPKPPTPATPGTCTRLYPSNHLSGDNDTVECDAAPNLLQADIAANWDYTGGALDYYYMYDAPQSSAAGTGQFANWAATGAAAGEAAISGFTHILDGALLSTIQSGGTIRAQFRMRSRYGVGISESAQNNLAAMAVRVYRPGTGFVSTLANVGTHAGAPKFVAQSLAVNRSFQATLAAYGSATSGDYLVVDIGTTHIGPLTGGTGASVFINDTASSDLPEDELESTNLRSWIEICSAGTAGDTTEPVGGPGDADTGTPGTYAPIDHIHEHGYLADDGIHMHDADQIDGLADTISGYVLTTQGGKHALLTAVSSGAAQTLDLADANVFDVTLDDDCTFTFSGATSGVECRFRLIMRQDATGSRVPTFPGSVVWPDNTEPTWSTAADAVDVIEFTSVDGGTAWFGDAGGSGGGASALDDLTDVTITSPTTGEVLTYNGSAWVNDTATAGALDDLTDATITAPATGDMLRYNGSAWVNTPGRWEPVTDNPGTGPELVWDGDEIVMTWSAT